VELAADYRRDRGGSARQTEIAGRGTKTESAVPCGAVGALADRAIGRQLRPFRVFNYLYQPASERAGPLIPRVAFGGQGSALFY